MFEKLCCRGVASLHMAGLIDTHCHLESFHRRGELPSVLEEAKAAGVDAMITVGTSMEDWALYSRLAEEYAGYVYWTVGLHPCHVEEDWQEQVMQIPTWFGGGSQPLALGEIGLDYFHLPKAEKEREQIIEWQKSAFRSQLEIALQMDCPIIIHSRNSFSDCVEFIDRSGVDWKKVVFHCFSGDAEDVRVLNGRGGRASFTGIVTYKNGVAVRQAALEQGLDTLMLETDSPYLSPEPNRGKPNKPAWVALTAASLAEGFGVSQEVLIDQTWKSSCKFFGISSI